MEKLNEKPELKLPVYEPESPSDDMATIKKEIFAAVAQDDLDTVKILFAKLTGIKKESDEINELMRLIFISAATNKSAEVVDWIWEKSALENREKLLESIYILLPDIAEDESDDALRSLQMVWEWAGTLHDPEVIQRNRLKIVDYSVLLKAVSNPSQKVLNWLCEKIKEAEINIEELLSANDCLIAKRAVESGNYKIFKELWLLAKQSPAFLVIKHKMLNSCLTQEFVSAAISDPVNSKNKIFWFLWFIAITDVKKNLGFVKTFWDLVGEKESCRSGLLIEAIKQKQFLIVKELMHLAQTPSSEQALNPSSILLSYKNNQAIRLAAEIGQPEILMELLNAAHADQRDDLLKIAFPIAAKNNQVDSVSKLLRLASSDMIRNAMLAADEYVVFREAASGTKLALIKRIWNSTSDPEVRKAMLSAKGYSAFYFADQNNHFGIANCLWTFTKSNESFKKAMLLNDGGYAFLIAAETGRYNIIRELEELANAQDGAVGIKKTLLRAGNFYAFKNAVKNGHLRVIIRLLKMANDDSLLKQEMFAAVESVNPTILVRLLEFADIELLQPQLKRFPLSPQEISSVPSSSLSSSSSSSSSALSGGNLLADAKGLDKTMILLAPDKEGLGRGSNINFDFDDTMLKGHAHKVLCEISAGKIKTYPSGQEGELPIPEAMADFATYSLLRALTFPSLRAAASSITDRDGAYKSCRNFNQAMEKLKKIADKYPEGFEAHFGEMAKIILQCTGGFKNKDKLKQLIIDALEDGHGVSITTFSVFPSFIKFLLKESLGLTQKQCDLITIVGGYPLEANGNPNPGHPQRKNFHLNFANYVQSVTSPALSALLDDDESNTKMAIEGKIIASGQAIHYAKNKDGCNDLENLGQVIDKMWQQKKPGKTKPMRSEKPETKEKGAGVSYILQSLSVPGKGPMSPSLSDQSSQMSDDSNKRKVEEDKESQRIKRVKTEPKKVDQSAQNQDSGWATLHSEGGEEVAIIKSPT